MKIETTRFGELEVDDASVIKMHRGPLGFEEQTDYVLIQHSPNSNFHWLQSVTESDLAFVVVDPADYYAGYEIEISDADAEILHLNDEKDALVLVIVNVAGGGGDVTANLIAPIVINSRELVGMQVVLQDSRYSVRHPLVEKVQQKTEDATVLEAA